MLTINNRRLSPWSRDTADLLNQLVVSRVSQSSFKTKSVRVVLTTSVTKERLSSDSDYYLNDF